MPMAVQLSAKENKRYDSAFFEKDLDGIPKGANVFTVEDAKRVSSSFALPYSSRTAPLILQQFAGILIFDRDSITHCTMHPLPSENGPTVVYFCLCPPRPLLLDEAYVATVVPIVVHGCRVYRRFMPHS